MIKWFDADRFLPGRECGIVLFRFENPNGHNYEIGHCDDGDWFCIALNPIETDSTKVTHWAFIEEPI